MIELSWKHSRVKVKDVNVVTRHVKARKQGETSKIKRTEAFIHISNVMPVDPVTGKAMRHNKMKSQSA